MSVKDLITSRSFDQILYVILVWSLFVFLVTRVYDTRLIRLETVVGTGILLIWLVWGIQYRLDQARKARFRRRR